MKKLEQVLKLIETDITNSKLVNGLKNIELDSSNYVTDISDVIFDLMGIPESKRTDELYQQYFKLINESPNKESAKEIYNLLKQT